MAELCSVFVRAELGLVHELKQNAQEHLAHRLGVLQTDSRALMVAAAKASAAAEFILKAGDGHVCAYAEPEALAA